MNIYNRLVLLIAVFAIAKTYSQTPYISTWFSADSNHLPQNSVKSITPDKYGYIWLATEGGLVRFDGQNFRVFDSGNVRGMKSSRMLVFGGSVENDSILMGNESHDMLLIHGRTVSKLKNITVIHPAETTSDIINNRYIINENAHFANRQAFGISSGNLHYIFSKDTIAIYGKKWELLQDFAYAVKDSAQFFTLNGSLYLMGKKGSYHKFYENKPQLRHFEGNFPNGIIYTNPTAGQVFFQAEDKLYLLEEINGLLTPTLIYYGFDFKKNNIGSIYFDSKNAILYLGSFNKGLLIVRKKYFAHIPPSIKHQTGTNGVYYALIPYSGEILASTGEVIGTGRSVYTIPIGDHTDKYMLAVDDNGAIWTKNSRKLYRYKKDNSYDEWVFPSPVTALCKAPDGRIWIGTFAGKKQSGGLLYYIDPGAGYVQPILYKKLPYAPAAINCNNVKTLWIGGWAGLWKFDIPTGASVRVPGIPNTHIRSIYLKDNDAWACSYGKGFFLHKEGKTTAFPTDRNKHLLTTHCIIEDKHGFFWVTTNKGLFQVRLQDLYAYANGKTQRVYYHYHNKNAGFFNNEFNGGCSPCGAVANGEIFFPSMDGIIRFNPKNVGAILPTNGIYFDAATIDGKMLATTGKLILNRNFDRVKFYISSPFFGESYNQVIETKLEGPVAQDWSPMTENNISFSTLPPGEYILKARKLNGFGSGWIHADLKFNIQPAFWQTQWFTAFAVLAGVFLVLIIIKLRMRYIRYKNVILQEKIVMQTSQLQDTITTLRKTRDDLSLQVANYKKLVKTITHDIKSPLKFLAITSRFIYNNYEKATPVKEDIEAIYTSSEQLYHFIDNFLEYAKYADNSNMKSEPYGLYILATEKIRFFKSLAANNKTLVENNIPQQITITINRHLLSIILHNLLDNAIKNTMAGKIVFNASIVNGQLSVSVKDTGKGMTANQVDYYRNLAMTGTHNNKAQAGMGLHIIAELMAILGGGLDIASGDSGTRITLSFRL